MKTPKKFIEKYVSYDDENHKWPQIVVIVIACLGSFTFGALFCWPSPSIPILISNSSHVDILTLEEASYFSVIPPITSIMTSPFIAILVDAIGRKKTVMLVAVPQLLSWILIIFADNIYIFYLSRAFAGIGEATLFGVLPTYVGEITLPSIRGTWGNMVSIFIYLGQLAINIVGAFCSIRTTALIFGCIPIIHILMTTLLPESPYYLLMKNQRAEARCALQKLRWKTNVEQELRIIAKDVDRQISESGSILDLFTIPTNRKALLIAIAIRGTQQLSGLAAFAVYTQYIFNQAGGDLPASICSIIFCASLVLSISCFAFIMDRFGRKPMMIFSCFGCFVMLMIEGTYFYIAQKTTIDVTSLQWIPLAGMLGYIIICSSGLGIIPTLMLGELFSASIKAKALGVLHICFALYVLSISKLYQTLSETFGMYVPFYLFSFFCFIGMIFSYYCIPETKGKTLEEIQQILRGDNYEEEFEVTRC